MRGLEEGIMAQDFKRKAIRPPAGILPDGILIGGLAAVLLIVLGVFAYRMMTRTPGPDLTADRSAIEQSHVPVDRDPHPKFRSTSAELRHKGAAEDAVTRLSDITHNQRAVSGQRVELKNVQVESANGNSFRIREGTDTMAVVGPAGTPALKGGQHVSLSGRVDATGGQVRINATRVDLHD